MSKDDIFADIEREGTDPFAKVDEQEETSGDSQPEEEEKDTPSQEGEESEEESKEESKDESKDEEISAEDNVPFHKHPRWKAMYEENQTLKDELSEVRDDMEDRFDEIDDKPSTSVPSWFSELYGDSPEAWGKYQEHTATERESLKAEIYDEMRAENQRLQEVNDEAQEWNDDQIQILKDEGLKFNENELNKIMLDFQPSDEDGNLDFQKGYEILQLKNQKDPEKSKARKELAASTTSDSQGEVSPKNYKTWAETKRRSFFDITG